MFIVAVCLRMNKVDYYYLLLLLFKSHIVNKGPVPLSRLSFVLDAAFRPVAFFPRGIFPVTFYADTHIDADSYRSATLLARPAEITRNSSGDEIANVNFLYDDIVHALKIQ